MGFYTPGLAHKHTFHVTWLANQSCRRLTTLLFVNLGLVSGISLSALCATLGGTPALAGAVFLVLSGTLAPYGAIIARREDLQLRISGLAGPDERARERYYRDCELIRGTVPNAAVREALIARRCEEFLDETRPPHSRLAA